MGPIIVVGLGNPGTEYETTRHNIGFRVVDELARRFRTPLRAGRDQYLSAVVSIPGKDLHLIKPLTYMNNSGVVVGELLERYRSGLDSLMIVADDFALPLGTIRVRAKGSDGGHNGLSSIIYQLNSNEFARTRCGIRQETMPPGEKMAEFVLSSFLPSEMKAVREMIQRAADAVIEFAESGISRAMNRFNARPDPETVT